MSDFLVLVGPAAEDTGALARVRAVLDALGRSPGTRASAPGSTAMVTARGNGTGGAIAVDPATGDWLLAAGTWFHAGGVGSGDEAQLLARIQRDGALAVARELEGFFVLAHGSASATTVTVIGDIAGACHAYVRAVPGGVAISTSAACLAALGPSSPDRIAVNEFLATGIIYEDRSLWSEVRKLPPACLRVYSGAGCAEQPAYWTLHEVTPERLTLDDAADAIGQALSAAARRIASRYPRVLCDVTGGYDSRATIAGFLAADLPFSATVSGPADSGDVRVSKAIAARFGLAHRHMTRQAALDAPAVAAAFRCTDGQYDLVEYARIAAIHGSHARDNDISLNGSFGELARAYWWELLFPAIGQREPLNAHRVAAARIGATSWDSAVLAAPDRIALVPHFTEVVTRATAGLADRPNTLQMDNVYFQLRMQRWQGRIASSTDHIWPCLSPFMLKSVLVPVLESQSRARMRSLLVRQMLDRLTPTLAAMPMEHGYPALPARASNLHRFWPLLPYYAGRVTDKLGRMMGRRSPATGSQPPSTAALLGADAAWAPRLEFAQFRASGMADDAMLDRFLTAATLPGFAFDPQFCRLFTIEVALAEVARARAAANP
jgi:hypothetical protein